MTSAQFGSATYVSQVTQGTAGETFTPFKTTDVVKGRTVQLQLCTMTAHPKFESKSQEWEDIQAQAQANRSDPQARVDLHALPQRLAGHGA